MQDLNRINPIKIAGLPTLHFSNQPLYFNYVNGNTILQQLYLIMLFVRTKRNSGTEKNGIIKFNRGRNYF